MPGTDFVIDFRDPDLAALSAVEFRSDSATGPLVARVPAQGVRRVSSQLFKRGERYWWTAVSPASTRLIGASFFVLDARRQRETRQEMAAYEKGASANDAQARAVLLADWLYGQDFPFDAAQTLLRAGLTIPTRAAPTATDAAAPDGTRSDASR